jgi:hypothetical protein
MVGARALIASGLLLGALAWPAGASAASLSPSGTIPLGNVAGAIDDLAFDFANQRLFVLESGAGHIAVVDLNSGAVEQTVEGLAGSTGLARDPEDDRLYVSTAAGKLAAFEGVPLKEAKGIDIGLDLGPPHYDAGSERIYFGYEGKKIGIVDTTHNKLWNSIRLDGRPGAMALEDDGTRMFVGAAGEGRILVADRADNKESGSWDAPSLSNPAALAIDGNASRLLAAFTQPATLAWFDLADGSMKGSAPSCAKPGRLLADADRGLIYVTCGEGSVEIYKRDNGGYAKLESLATGPGAVTALLAPTSGRLYLAVPAGEGHGAEIRIYAPPGS